MSRQTKDFGSEWINAWNSHDLDAIMGHYSETIDFSSPFIKQMGVDEKGTIGDKKQLRSYFETALQKYPDLNFELFHELTGIGSVVLFYKSVNELLAAEYMEFDGEGRICRVRAHYK